MSMDRADRNDAEIAARKRINDLFEAAKVLLRAQQRQRRNSFESVEVLGKTQKAYDAYRRTFLNQKASLKDVDDAWDLYAHAKRMEIDNRLRSNLAFEEAEVAENGFEEKIMDAADCLDEVEGVEFA